MQLAHYLMPLVGAAVILAWRVRETARPMTLPKIIMPPLGMSTGLCMFLLPATRVPWSWALGTFALGAFVLSYPLIKTSQLIAVNDQILLKRSKAFLWIFLGLFAIRFVARTYLEEVISPLQTAGLFFLLAFGMILRWRIGMLLRFNALSAKL
jgi:membrane protein CcdC involved in cytochrome C biogenesis